jgi:hypothetical protein
MGAPTDTAPVGSGCEAAAAAAAAAAIAAAAAAAAAEGGPAPADWVGMGSPPLGMEARVGASEAGGGNAGGGAEEGTIAAAAVAAGGAAAVLDPGAMPLSGTMPGMLTAGCGGMLPPPDA